MPHEIHSFSLTVIISFILTLSICLSITFFRLYFLVLLFLFLLLFRRLLIENTDTLNLLNVTFFHTHYFLSHWFFWIYNNSIITTFCNFLNIIKLYRREQRELSLVWPCPFDLYLSSISGLVRFLVLVFLLLFLLLFLRLIIFYRFGRWWLTLIRTTSFLLSL